MAIEFPFELDTFQKEVPTLKMLFYHLDATKPLWLPEYVILIFPFE